MSPAKKRATRQTVIKEPDDIFGGMGHFVPCPTIQMVEVKPPTKAQRKKLIQRLIDKLDPPREVIVAQKQKPVKRAPKKKKTPPPKKGKPVAKATEILIQSPYDKHPQWVPLVPSISELLTEGWVIVDGGDVPADQAYEFLNITPEELQSA